MTDPEPRPRKMLIATFSSVLFLDDADISNAPEYSQSTKMAIAITVPRYTLPPSSVRLMLGFRATGVVLLPMLPRGLVTRYSINVNKPSGGTKDSSFLLMNLATLVSCFSS